MAKTFAFLVVTTPRVFTWLGHMPIMNWTLEQLREVRGIDRVVCVALPDLARRAAELLAAGEIETIAVPPKIKADGPDLDRWLTAADGPAADADVVVVLKPSSPFLPAAKIEVCVDAVRRCLADRSCTVQPVQVVSGTGREAAHAEAPGCRAFAPARAREPARRPFRPVPVSPIEALDVSEPDDYHIASALLLSGAR
jgi:CTP:molybdopterin cytidylyltransferase MocA